MVLETVPTVPTIQLRDTDGDGVYRAIYESFDEAGEYRIVVHAVDTEGLEARPKAVQVVNEEKTLGVCKRVQFFSSPTANWSVPTVDSGSADR